MNKKIKMTDAIHNLKENKRGPQLKKGLDAVEFQEFTPQSAIIALHIENLVNTYGKEVVNNVFIHNFICKKEQKAG